MTINPLGLRDNEALTVLLKKSIEQFSRLSPEEQEKILDEQRKSWVRAEMSWPKPKFHWENGVKVYESFEDYCND